MKNATKYIILLVIIIGVSCTDNTDYSAPNLYGECVIKNTTQNFQYLTEKATENNTIYNITTNEILEGFVVSNDEAGNFYKTLSVVSTDNSLGINLAIDATALFTSFEPGRKIYIHLKDLNFEKATTFTNGINLGLNYQTPDGNFRIGRIDPMYINKHIQRGCEKVNEDVLVKKLTITEAKNENYLNQLIEISEVQFSEKSLGHTYFDEALKSYNNATAIDHNILDNQGNSLTVRISKYAHFALNKIASGNGKIRGILTKYNNNFQLIIRTINDIDFKAERYKSEIENFENFDANKYQILTIEGTNSWFATSANENRFLQARKAASTGNTTTFFVMPYNFNTYNKISFQSQFGYMSRYTNPKYNPTHYNMPILKVYYSLNFNAQNPTENLIDITDKFTFSPHKESRWAQGFTSSGTYTFNGINGQGHIIFAYEANFQSNASVAETRPAVRIDNIVFEN